VLFVWIAIKALLKEGTSLFSRYLVLLSLFASVYMWIFALAYVPSEAIWILTLALTGLLVASLCEDKSMEVSNYSVVGKPAASFISVLLIVLALIGSVAFAYFVTVKACLQRLLSKGSETL